MYKIKSSCQLCDDLADPSNSLLELKQTLLSAHVDIETSQRMRNRLQTLKQDSGASPSAAARLKTAPASPSGSLGAAALQKLFEEVPEFCVEYGVDDGVESAVDVAEPRYHAH